MRGEILPFTATEITWGLTYARNDAGIELNPVLLCVLANTIRYYMERPKKREFEDVQFEVLRRAFKTEFARTRNKKKLEKEYQAYADALGKMFNNRKNVRHVNFTPTKRVGPKRSRTAKILTMSTGQRVIKF